MLHLLKYLDGPWERVREYLRSDLEHIEAAVNQRWQQTFTDDNLLQAFAISGDSTIDTQYIANTGTGHTPKWDYVNLSNGVTNRLPFNHLVAATAPSVLVGRESGTTGNFEQISLGTGLTMTGTTLSANSAAGGFAHSFLTMGG